MNVTEYEHMISHYLQDRVPLIAQSGNLELEEVETQRKNGGKLESERGREKERER